MRRLTIDAVQKAFEQRGYILISETYKNNRTDLEYRCLKHPEVIQKIRYDNFQSGKGCHYCGIEKSAMAKMIPYNKLKKSFEDRNYTLLTTEEERNIKRIQYLDYICNKHPEIIQHIELRSFNQGHGCKFCSTSRGENKIKEWLIDHQIDYIPQKTYDDLKDIRCLSYDFYLPTYNLLIEYQGEFHDGNNRIQQIDKLNTQQLHDTMKQQYANEHGIKLLQIWYYENIEQKLISILN